MRVPVTSHLHQHLALSGFRILATSCKELTHWKRLWCWKGLGAGGEGNNRGWDGWMASLTRWAWVWVNSGSWWWTGRPGVLRFMGSQIVGHDWVIELNWTEWMCGGISFSKFVIPWWHTLLKTFLYAYFTSTYLLWLVVSSGFAPFYSGCSFYHCWDFKSSLNILD